MTVLSLPRLEVCTTGDAPDGWTATLVGTGAAFSMQSGSGIRCRTGTGFNGGNAYYNRFRLNGPCARVSGVAVFSSLTDTGFWLTVSIGAQRAAAATNGYCPGGYAVKFEPQAANIEVSRESTHSVLQTVTGITYVSRMAFEMQVVGTRILARVWDESQPRPGWQCDVLDTAPSQGADDQWVGIGWKGLVDLTVDLARLEIDDLNGAPE